VAVELEMEKLTRKCTYVRARLNVHAAAMSHS